MHGIFTLVNQGTVFEATIGTGQAYSIQDWLEQCFRIVGKDWREHVDLERPFAELLLSRFQSEDDPFFGMGSENGFPGAGFIDDERLGESCSLNKYLFMGRLTCI